MLWGPRMRHIPLLALLVAGCGGSSSETPPPLEPDPTSYRYSGPRLQVLPDATAAEPEPEVDEDDLPATTKKPAAATWGSGRPAPRASAAPSAAPPMITPAPAAPAPTPSASAAPAALPAK